jgi:Fic family protein
MDQIEKLCECIEQQVDGVPSPVLGCDPQQSSFAKASADKPSSFAEATLRRPEQSIINSVYESIKRPRKGIAFVQIQKKTGFNRRQVANAIYKLKERGMITALKRGVYAWK